MRSRSAVPLAVVLALTACAEAAIVPLSPPPEPEPSLTQAPAIRAPIEINAEASTTQAKLLAHAERGSLRGLAEIAARNSLFLSNTGGQDHLQFWDLLRRTGVDPNRHLRELFDLPPGRRTVDGVDWYVWPDLAARDAGDLLPEKLTFEERKRLLDYIGDDGIARLRAGEGYPGMRTAIAEDGRWIYFVLGQDGEG